MSIKAALASDRLMENYPMENETYFTGDEKSCSSITLSRSFKNVAVFLGSLLLILIVTLIEVATDLLWAGELIRKANITILIAPPIIGYAWANSPFDSIRNCFKFFMLIIFTIIFNLFAAWALLAFMGIPLM